jgi:HPr kinase/phosphorylase
MITIHATTVSLDGRGVILRGPSGSGKSDLALRLINEGALLVADDQTILFVESGRMMAQPPAEIAGKMEVRGVGIVKMGPPTYPAWPISRRWNWLATRFRGFTSRRLKCPRPPRSSWR